MRRMKLKNYVCGPNTRMFQILTLSGTSDTWIENTDYYSDFSTYISPQDGAMSGIPSKTPISIISGGILVDIDDGYERQYETDIIYNVDTGTRGPSASQSHLIDMQQFGDKVFGLSKETVYGIENKLNMTNHPSTSHYYEGEPIKNTPGSAWYMTPHELAVYFPLSARLEDPELSSEVDAVVDSTGFDFWKRKIIFGTIQEFNGDDEIYAYVKSKEKVIDEYWHWPTSALCYGYTDGIQFSYLIEQDLTNNVDHCGLTGNIYVNPCKTKNMYDYNWETQIGKDRNTLEGLRNYLNIGKTQNTFWLKYKYIKDYDYEFSTNEGYYWEMSPIQRYDLIEKIKGLYKFSAHSFHKSNIYSIKINNSNLNEAISDITKREAIQGEVEKSVREIVKKIAPAYAQLWKVIWTGS